MRKILLIVLPVLFTVACSRKDKIPRGILSQKEMVSVLWDMFRADEYTTNYILAKDSSLSKKDEYIKSYEQIFDIHHIDKDRFKKSFSFYQSHPKLMQDVLDSMYAKGTDVDRNDEKPVITDTILKQKLKPIKAK